MRIVNDPVFLVTGDTTTDVLIEMELGTRVVMCFAWERLYAPEDNIRFMLRWTVR